MGVAAVTITTVKFVGHHRKMFFLIVLRFSVYHRLSTIELLLADNCLKTNRYSFKFNSLDYYYYWYFIIIVVFVARYLTA